jgi:hypothetical protein
MSILPAALLHDLSVTRALAVQGRLEQPSVWKCADNLSAQRLPKAAVRHVYGWKDLQVHARWCVSASRVPLQSASRVTFDWYNKQVTNS